MVLSQVYVFPWPIQHARILSRLVIEMVTNSPSAKSSISGECILCILAYVTMALAVGPSPASSTPICREFGCSARTNPSTMAPSQVAAALSDSDFFPEDEEEETHH